MKSFVVAILIVAVATATAEDITIESPHITNWGDWGPMELCEPGNFVYGMRLKSSKPEGILGDDTALNGIDLLCINPTVKRNSPEFLAKDPVERAFQVIHSTVGHEGDYGSIFECPEPEFATGFQMLSEEDQGWTTDDSAANNLRLICSGGSILEGDGDTWGIWTTEQRCPRGLVVCGIQTQVEASGAIDETSLNNVRMGCCAKP